MRAGLRRYRVTFQRLSATTNEYGEAIKTWSDIGSRWVVLEFTAGDEASEGDRRQPRLGGLLRMMYTTAYRPNDRFKFGDRTMQIEAIINHDRRATETVMRFQETV